MSRWRNLHRKHRQWQALQSWERTTLLQFAFLLPITWIGLRVLGFARMRRFCESALPSSPNLPVLEHNVHLAQAQRYAALAAIAARHGLYSANCLHQSLPLCWLLRRKGLPAQLKIGVKPNMRDFQAHAWVEVEEGVPLKQTDVGYQCFSDGNNMRSSKAISN